METNSEKSYSVRHREMEIQESMDSEDFESRGNKSSRWFKNPSWWLEKHLYLLLPYLHIKRHIRFTYFIVAIVLFSLVRAGGEFFSFEFLTGKQSIFNQVFVKLGWGWTLSLILLLRIGCLPLHSNWKHHLLNVLFRLSSLTFFFYLFCQVIFPLIEEWTGYCVKNGIIVDFINITKKSCLKRKGHTFNSFDISGHSFLMPYCILSLTEESKELIYVLCLGQFLRHHKSENNSARPEESEEEMDEKLDVVYLSPSELKVLERKHLFVIPFIFISTLAVSLLCLLWDTMLIVTTLYYHSFIEKATGSLLAMAVWYLQCALIFPGFNIL